MESMKGKTQDNESQMLAEAFSLLGKSQLKGIQEVHFHGKNRSLGLTPRNGVKCSLTAGVSVISDYRYVTKPSLAGRRERHMMAYLRIVTH